jgi:hypothetical protein
MVDDKDVGNEQISSSHDDTCLCSDVIVRESSGIAVHGLWVIYVKL